MFFFPPLIKVPEMLGTLLVTWVALNLWESWFLFRKCWKFRFKNDHKLYNFCYGDDLYSRFSQGSNWSNIYRCFVGLIIGVFNPPTIWNHSKVPLSKMPIGFVHTWWYHLNSVGSKLYMYVLPFKSIQMVLEGPLIHHLEVSKQGFVLAVLPFGKIQTRFCISWPTCIIQNHLGNQHCTQLFHHSKPQ